MEAGVTQRETDATPRWSEIAKSTEFLRLERMRRQMVAVFLGIFVVAFGTFIVLCAYARPFMGKSVSGGLTMAYVWLLALTVLAWILTWLYLRLSERRLEPLAQRIVERAHGIGESRDR